MTQQYTYAEAAKKLRVAETTLRRWVSQGRISCHRLGRLVRFTDDDLDSALKPAPALPAASRRRTSRR
jgi:excisionase family DNA binding protein